MATLHIIGAGTPTPTPSAFGTSYVLQLGSEYLMFDCGPATTYKLVKAGLFPTMVDYLFFTHHHFDHNADYPCFLLCRWDQSHGQENPLKVFGPPRTARMTELLIGERGAFAQDWKARIGAPVSQSVHKNRGGSLPRPSPNFLVEDVGPGKVVETSDWSVISQRVHHVDPWLESLAYRVDSQGLQITFAGDAEKSNALIDFARGSDVLVVNCWDHQEKMDRNGEAPGQTGTLDAAIMARDSGARKLILTHTGPGIRQSASREKAISDISSIYSGETIFAEEMTALELC